MDFELNEDQKLLKKTIEDFRKRELDAFLDELPEQPMSREVVLEVLKMIRPFGALGARLPRDVGGEGLSNVSTGVLWEEFPPEIIMTASSDIFSFRLYHGGSKEIQEQYIPPMLRGEIIAGSSISEVNAGSDLRSFETTAVPDGDHYVVNGTKIWSSHGSHSDILLVAVSLGKDERGRTILGRLLVDREQSPYKAREVEMIGLRRHNLSEVVFEDCRVPKRNLVGEPGDAVRLFTLSWLAQRPLMGLCAVHLGQRSLEASVEYAKTRREFGKPIAAFQMVQGLLVEMATLVETSRLLCYKALSALDSCIFARKESSMAKFYATESAVKVTSIGIQVHGSYGLSREYKVEKYFRDARMLTMPDGTTEIQKLQVGRELTGINAIR